MKSTVANQETRVFCVRIVAVDGTTLRFASYPYDLIMANGAVYQTDSGYQPTAITSASNGAADVLDLSGVFAVAGLSEDKLISGLFDNARAFAFATSWASPVEDEEPLGKYIMGKSRIEDDRYVIEKMALIDALSQNVGRTCGPLCPWTLFDATIDGESVPYARSRCTGPRAAPDGPVLASYKVTGTVTAVTSNRQWQDAALVTSPLAYAASYFDYGSVRWTSGSNAGLRSSEVKQYAADGTVTTYLPAHYTILVGDAYEMVPGCDHRRTGDCINKYNNAINSGGFDRMAAPSQYAERGTK